MQLICIIYIFFMNLSSEIAYYLSSNLHLCFGSRKAGAIVVKEEETIFFARASLIFFVKVEDKSIATLLRAGEVDE